MIYEQSSNKLPPFYGRIRSTSHSRAELLTQRTSVHVVAVNLGFSVVSE